MNLGKLHKITRVILIIIPVIFFGWLIAQDLVVDGQLEASYNFEKQSPFVLTLAPKDRISPIQQENNEYYRSLFDEPVYFDVRLPRYFKEITFWVKYRAEESEVVRLAAFANKDEWSSEIKDFEEIKNLADGWQEGRVSFNLEQKRFIWQKYQFMFSLPEIRDSGRQVDIAEIKMLATRDPLTWSTFWQKIKNRLF